MQLDSKYSREKVEEKIYNFWEKNNYFAAKVNKARKPFSIVIPPPNITGILHMGHALNNTIQDVLIRFKRMQGYEALWMPGTDHAGIATQNVVERQLATKGLKKEDVGREEFLRLLWDWKEKYGSTIIEQLKKLGASCDWARTRFTMDEAYSEAVKEVFVRLFQKGLIYRGEYIINWCPRCKTALSDEEAPHKEIEGWLYYIRYPVKVNPSSGEINQKYIEVATTRPETMLGDTAIAINPGDRRYEWLKKVKVILPIMERELPVIEDEVVDPEFGTGVVKVTPAHDHQDFMLAKKHNLSFINIMNEDGSLNENGGQFAGMDRFEARQAILKVLESKGLLARKEPYTISAGHCYRCNTVVEPRLSLQWFVKMKPLAEPAIRVVEEDKIRFYPQRWKKVYLHWMYNIQDWCISRQIWWGHRLPVWYCKRCQNNSKDSSSPGENKGVIVSRSQPQSCPVCGSQELVQEEDVLDTWFSSWLWPFATFYWPFNTRNDPVLKSELDYFYPTSVLVTASEILFFWVARMIMAGLEFTGKIPFRDVFIHGTVRDDKGIKMSKSLGNIIDPLEIIDKFGADSLRFSLMMLASAGADVYLSDEKFLVGRNFSNKIWNAARFILMKMEENNILVKDLNLDFLTPPDKWILNRLNDTIEAVTLYLESYRINEAAKQIYEFFWHNFCDWYVEIAKDNFCLDTAKVLIYCLINSLKLLHPFMPFITEEIFQLIKSTTKFALEESIMIGKWPERVSIPDKDKALEIMNTAIQMIREIRNLKVDLGIQPTKKLILLMKVSDESKKEFFIEQQKWIERLANLKEIRFVDKLERVLFKVDTIEGDFLIQEIDREKFLLTLKKKIEEVEKQLSGVESKLSNEGFLKNAPSQVIVREKEKLSSLSTQKERLIYLKNMLK